MKVENKIDFINEISEFSTIENSRMIFDFLEELDCQLKINDEEYVYTGEGGLRTRQAKIEKIQNEVYLCLENTWDGNNYLYQNPLSHYMMFWEQYFGKKMFFPEKDVGTKNGAANNDRIPELLHLYQIVKYLSCAEIKHDDLPYLYEDVCITAANIFNCYSCYIVYDGGNNTLLRLIASSGYCSKTGYFLRNTVSNFKKHIIDNEKEVVRFKNKDYYYNVIKWPLMLHQKDADKKHICLIFEGIEIKDTETIKIRFLRERLMEVLERDLGTLLAYRHDFGYIKSINAKFNKNWGFPKILHISDLHITDNDSWNISGEKSKSVCEQLNDIVKTKGEYPIDLVAVTGDVVQGAESASMAQERYHKAALYLQQIAVSMWGVEDKATGVTRLSHDWKRRFMVITGNHDYLTMNELVSVNKARQTRFGSPDTNHNTGTMVKFTYFVSFLMEFLDEPIESLIKNDLNELRVYENLNTKVLMLNTVSNANVLQNNKVGISENALDLLISQWNKDDGYKRMCLMHHGPGYKIDYVSDSYEPWKFFSTNEKEKLNLRLKDAFAEFKSYVEYIDDVSLGTFKTKYKSLISAINNTLIELKNGEIDKSINDFRASELFADMQELANHSEFDVINEFFIELTSKFRRYYDTSEVDRKAFHNNIKRIAENGNVLFLSGHIHNSLPIAWDEPEMKKTKNSNNNYCFISDKIEASFAIIYKNPHEHYKRKQYEWKADDKKYSQTDENPIIYPTYLNQKVLNSLRDEDITCLFSKYITFNDKDKYVEYVNNYVVYKYFTFKEYINNYTE